METPSSWALILYRTCIGNPPATQGLFVTRWSHTWGGTSAVSHGWMLPGLGDLLTSSISVWSCTWVIFLSNGSTFCDLSAAKSISNMGLPSSRNSLSFFAVAFVSPKCCFYTLVINIPTNSTAYEVFKELFVISLKVLCKVYFKLFLDLSISCLCITYHFLKGFSSFWQAFHFLNAKFFPVIAF